MSIITSETPSQRELRHFYRYNPETGVFHRAEDGYLGHITNRGYRRMKVDGKQYFIHRLIWKYVTGEEAELIDHKDGDKLNNKWDNLRSVNQLLNCKNARQPKINTSGSVGVHFNTKSKRWVARVSVNNGRIVLGTFSTIAEAAEARQQFLTKHPELGFTTRHGT